MKARLFGLACVAASLLGLFGAVSAKAEFHIEPIVALLEAPPSNRTTFEQYYPEELHFNMYKELTFEGTFKNQDPTLPAHVDFWFDWIDPIFGPMVTVPPWHIDLDP